MCNYNQNVIIPHCQINQFVGEIGKFPPWKCKSPLNAIYCFRTWSVFQIVPIKTHLTQNAVVESLQCTKCVYCVKHEIQLRHRDQRLQPDYYNYSKMEKQTTLQKGKKNKVERIQGNSSIKNTGGRIRETNNEY